MGGLSSRARVCVKVETVGTTLTHVRARYNGISKFAFAPFNRKEANAAEQILLSAERSHASNANIIDAKLPGPGCIL